MEGKKMTKWDSNKCRRKCEIEVNHMPYVFSDALAGQRFWTGAKLKHKELSNLSVDRS